jgi:hypothetical protein
MAVENVIGRLATSSVILPQHAGPYSGFFFGLRLLLVG